MTHTCKCNIGSCKGMVSSKPWLAKFPWSLLFFFPAFLSAPCAAHSFVIGVFRCRPLIINLYVLV